MKVEDNYIDAQNEEVQLELTQVNVTAGSMKVGYWKDYCSEFRGSIGTHTSEFWRVVNVSWRSNKLMLRM